MKRDLDAGGAGTGGGHGSVATEVALPSGRVLRVETTPHERVLVTSPDGQLEVAIRFTPEGPVLQLQAVGLSLASQGKVRIDCDELEVNARGRMELGAREVSIEAREGDLRTLSARDHWLNGRYVLLNCDRAAPAAPADRQACCDDCGDAGR